MATLRFKGIRGVIAKKMRESLNATAQLSFFCDVDASALVAARSAWKATEVRIGYEDLIIRALADLLAGFPHMNAVEQADGVEEVAEINIGCAIALPGALVAPAILNADELNVVEISRRRADLVDRAKANKLSIAELTNGTISVSNLGLTRVQHFTPILNYPQMAIIGLGQITQRAWVDQTNNVISARPVMGLSLTVDHRAIDGAPAGEFLTSLANKLETDPAMPSIG